MKDSSPPPAHRRRPWRFWEATLLLLSCGAIVMLFALAISQDRTRVATYFSQATATTQALVDQTDADEVALAATVQPTDAKPPADQTPATAVGSTLPNPARAGAMLALSTSTTAHVSSPTASTAANRSTAISRQATNEQPTATIPSATERAATAQVAAAPEVARDQDEPGPSMSTADNPSAAQIDEAAMRSTGGALAQVAQAEASVVVQPDEDATPAPAAALAAAGETPSDAERRGVLRLPTPTPVLVLEPSLQTPVPEIGEAISSTLIITTPLLVSPTVTPISTTLAPPPEIGDPISLTLTATVTPPPLEIGEAVSTTAPISLALTVPATETTPTASITTTETISQILATATATATATAPIPADTPLPVPTVSPGATGPTAPSTPSPTPTATSQPTPRPTATSTATATASATETATATMAIACSSGTGGTLDHQAKYYAGPLVAYDQDARLVVRMAVENASPGELGSGRLNLYLSDRAQFTRIIEEAEPPREQHIEAGVVDPDAPKRLLATIGRPVGDFYLTIVNDSGTAVDFCLTLENGTFQ